MSRKHERLSRKYDPLAVRQLILNSHYRSPIDFSDAALTAAQSGYDKITEAVINLRMRMDSAPQGAIDNKMAGQLLELKKKFEEAMNDDFNTAVALSVVFDIVNLANQVISDKNTSQADFGQIDSYFRNLSGDVLGVSKS